MTEANVLQRVLRAFLADARPHGSPLPAILAIGLQRFRSSSEIGSGNGNPLLARVERRMLRVVPKGAIVARIGVDALAVLLPDGRDSSHTVSKLLECLSRPFSINGRAITLGVHIGLAAAHNHDDDAEALLQGANIALHHARQSGKAQWCLFEPWMQARASSRQALEVDLRSALAIQRHGLHTAMPFDQFNINYQPQVATLDRRLLGFEALVRWRHPLIGMTGPDLFIRLSEEMGLIGVLGDWVLETACCAAAGWPLGPGDVPYAVAVNVSPVQLRDRKSLLTGIATALERSGLAPGRLQIEITERALNRDVHVTLQEIRALGVSLSLDDFGTGYSSLGQLSQYPFDRLKIDRTFVHDLPTGIDPEPAGAPHALWMLQTIATLGSRLGMSTVAEGIETEGQAECVRRAGVPAMQGYLFARPAEVCDLPALMRTMTGAGAVPAPAEVSPAPRQTSLNLT